MAGGDISTQTIQGTNYKWTWNKTTGYLSCQTSGITEIPGWEFADNTELDIVQIADDIVSIGCGAFCNCANLRKIIIPKTTSCESSIVEDCKLLKTAGPIGSGCNIEFGWDTSIFYGAFLGSCIEDVIIPHGIVYINGCAFMGTKLTSVSIPDTVESIGKDVFYNCDNLTKVIIGKSVTYMGDSAFRNCPKLTSAGPIGSGCSIEFEWIDMIPDDAFHNSNISSFHIPSTIKFILPNAIYNDNGVIPTTIRFNGTIDEWNHVIVIGPNMLSDTCITCNNGITFNSITDAISNLASFVKEFNGLRNYELTGKKSYRAQPTGDIKLSNRVVVKPGVARIVTYYIQSHNDTSMYEYYFGDSIPDDTSEWSSLNSYTYKETKRIVFAVRYKETDMFHASPYIMTIKRVTGS